jgi:membrane-bound lytic murein transglycosylase A
LDACRHSRARVILAALVGLLAGACASLFQPPDKLVLEPQSFSDLPGWETDNHAEALAAFARSCAQLTQNQATAVAAVGIAASDWQPICAASTDVQAGDNAQAKAFFERWFRPVAARNNYRAEGLFTGYYEPVLKGSRQPSGAFATPLYMRPPDLIGVDLGLFRPDLKGKRLAGQVIDGQLLPYADRAAIEAGVLARRGLEIAWVDDPVDAFFMHIQGSGRVELNDGTSLRLNYAAQNGHPYTPIGRLLIERGVMPAEAVSMQAIRAWLVANPGDASALMNANASYIFFRELTGEGPVGSLSVPLTPGRSLAVDREFVPLGVPVWLAATRPNTAPGADEGTDVALQRLLVAQDTGGAIRGPVRGDVYWGSGPVAAAIAGRMKHLGRYWLLLPIPAAALIAKN